MCPFANITIIIYTAQVSTVEAADRLLGHKLFSKLQQLRFADIQ